VKTCDDFQRDVYAYLDGELEPSEREVYGRHLEACENCSSIFNEAVLMEKELQEGYVIREIEPPGDGWDKFQQRLYKDEDLSLDIDLPKLRAMDRISHHFRRNFSAYGLAAAASVALYLSGPVPEKIGGFITAPKTGIELAAREEASNPVLLAAPEFKRESGGQDILDSYSLASLAEEISQGNPVDGAKQAELPMKQPIPFLERVEIQESDLNQMIEIPKGKTFLGNNESPEVPAFQIDKFPVTNLEYAKFVQATGHRAPFHWGNDGYDAVDSTGFYPVTHISWEDARAFCSWEEKSLLTHHQWVRAARGDSKSRFPWGSQFDPALANTRESGLGLLPIGQISGNQSPFGVSEMAGNVSEWLQDSYTGEAVKGLAPKGQFKLMKGGSFLDPGSKAEVGAYSFGEKDTLYGNSGIRCASGL